ncbi:GNAT family N-acetyltransferase [Aminipila terrae]|nr:N-acetyltransferase [Aminipila terrae]
MSILAIKIDLLHRKIMRGEIDMPSEYELRLETVKDYKEVENLTREAFWNKYRPGCTEHYVLHRYRMLPEFVKELDYVIEEEGKIVAHIMYSRAEIEEDNGQIIPILIFGPVSVLPEMQGKGYGGIIIRHTLNKAAELGYGAVAITGNPDYYHRFGFVSGSSVGIYYSDMPREEEAPFFMVKTLKNGFLDGITGTYHDPKGYKTSEDEVEAFDASFSPKEKKKLPGQLA